MKKVKKTPEELAKEREERLDNAEKKLRYGIMSLERSRDQFFSGMMEARDKRLATQEQQYRNSLAKCLAQIKMQEGALMTLRLARQTRDLVEAQKEFVNCLGLISQDIDTSKKKTNVKKAENQYLRAKFAVQQQTDDIDNLLELDRFSDVADAQSGKYSEFDAEIDAMITSSSVGGFSDRDKRRF